MAFTSEQTAMLEEPLAKSEISTRKQAGIDLDYVDGFYVIDQANKVFGFDGWEGVVRDITRVQEAETLKDGRTQHRVAYICTYRLTVNGVTREDVGFGNGIDSDIGKAHESASKEAVTDAMKRCFRTFGYRFGLALYDKSREHVEDDTKPKPVTKTPAQIAYDEYLAAHKAAGFPAMDKEVMAVLKRVVGIEPDKAIDEYGWRWLRDWAVEVQLGFDDVPTEWTDRVKAAMRK